VAACRRLGESAAHCRGICRRWACAEVSNLVLCGFVLWLCAESCSNLTWFCVAKHRKAEHSGSNRQSAACVLHAVLQQADNRGLFVLGRFSAGVTCICLASCLCCTALEGPDLCCTCQVGVLCWPLHASTDLQALLPDSAIGCVGVSQVRHVMGVRLFSQGASVGLCVAHTCARSRVAFVSCADVAGVGGCPAGSSGSLLFHVCGSSRLSCAVANG
jgi:hypothetical protein